MVLQVMSQQVHSDVQGSMYPRFDAKLLICVEEGQRAHELSLQ